MCGEGGEAEGGRDSTRFLGHEGKRGFGFGKLLYRRKIHYQCFTNPPRPVDSNIPLVVDRMEKTRHPDLLHPSIGAQL